MGYKQGIKGAIIRAEDGAIIPQDPQNVDYQAYLAWVESGNTAAPLPSETLAQVVAAQIASISAACEAAIVSGFTSSALGSVHTYPSTETDQRNLLGSAFAAQGRDSGWASPLWCTTDAGQWAFLPHSAAQVQQVNADWVDFRDVLRRKYANLIDQVNAATSISEVGGITW
ncbi:hypothetical protein [Ralstonia solanacearum]|uniref:DUF4376 domain-containing protein n=1 Tax=Ralstonia solanacearum TaxID=305 RepID=UPI001E50D276|nr:hypothetical protein [Ralstonia solanacearum]